jgi:hypothetical protein
MNLTEARDKLAAVLAPIEDTDPHVLISLVDALEPPALMLGWGEPWLTPDTICWITGRIIVTCVAARLSPGPGIATLEDLVAYTLARTRTEPENWVLETVSGPRVFLIAKTNYLACRVQFKVALDG